MEQSLRDKADWEFFLGGPEEEFLESEVEGAIRLFMYRVARWFNWAQVQHSNPSSDQLVELRTTAFNRHKAGLLATSNLAQRGWSCRMRLDFPAPGTRKQLEIVVRTVDALNRPIDFAFVELLDEPPQSTGAEDFTTVVVQPPQQ